MHILALTDNPQALISAIDQAIGDGDLDTWGKVQTSNMGTFYNHTPEQWHNTAMIRPTIATTGASFRIAWLNRDGEPSLEVKYIILGRFTEALLVHFRDHFRHLITYK